MLDHNEIAQARCAAMDAIAEVETAIHGNHGSYTYLCEWHGMMVYAHQPFGRVLHTYTNPVEEGSP